MLIYVVARTRLDRYEELHRQFEDWRDVRIVLDRREGERRESNGTSIGVERRREERRRRLDSESYVKLGWSMVDTDELIS